MQRPTKYSAASSPRTNPLRSNNERDRDDPSSSLGNTMSSGTGRSSADVSGSEEVSQTLDERLAEEQRGRQKLNQIVQQFFLKGALAIVGSRVHFPPWYKNDQLKQNRWFNVVLNDAEELLGQLLTWKALDVFDARPAPLTIETYIDLSDLTPSQTLVVIDNNGSRWDVAEALNPQRDHAGRPSARRATNVILERWTIELGEASSAIPSEAAYDLPSAYKKAVVLFRSLFTYTRTMPAWKYFRRIAKNPPNSPALRLKYRISDGRPASNARDLLEVPLVSESGPVTQQYVFEPSLSPAGPFCISVTYRENCDFRVDESESLLSSQFMASDDQYFRPSLSPRRSERRPIDPAPGSLPARRHQVGDVADPSQAYGSLSTFHGEGMPGTSPISALRNIQWPGAERSPTGSPAQAPALNRRGEQIRSEQAMPPPYQRRPSVSFQAFKAGSLASSPASGLYMPTPQSPSNASLGRDRRSSAGLAAPNGQSSSLPHHRSRTSITTLPQQALRAPIYVSNETASASSASGSPKPAPIARYSSSFSSRRNRFSSASGGAGVGSGASNSRIDDGDAGGGNNSSGKVSVSSSLRADNSTPEIGGTTTGTAAGASSGSMQEADENSLQAFIKLLENKKELKSFSRTDSTAKEANISRTTAALNKYQRMRDSNAQLSDSLSSSLMLQRSSSSSSRQLSAVPPMVADRAGSLDSTSPGKPISPHTPHTPAIPSRLSAETNFREIRRSRSGGRHASGPQRQAEPELESELDSAGLNPQTSNAIPIPTSPNHRAWLHNRRSSSVAQQQRAATFDGDVDDQYGHTGLRSTSLPPEEGRGDISMSELLRLTAEPSAVIPAGAAVVRREQSMAAYASRRGAAEGTSYREHSSPHGGRGSSGSSGSRWRIPDPSYAAAHASSAPAPNASRGSRYSFSSRPRRADDEDDEPLLFAMSEIGGGGSGSRRSIEDGRAGSSSSGPSARGRGSTLGDARGLGGDCISARRVGAQEFSIFLRTDWTAVRYTHKVDNV